MDAPPNLKPDQRESPWTQFYSAPAHLLPQVLLCCHHMAGQAPAPCCQLLHKGCIGAGVLPDGVVAVGHHQLHLQQVAHVHQQLRQA
jgi:hypothetical protein